MLYEYEARNVLCIKKRKKNPEITYLFLLGNHIERLSNYPIKISIKWN